MTQVNFNNKKELAKYINFYLHRLLKNYGFKKNGNDFYLKLDSFNKIISIQKHRYVDENELYFTLNWGVFFYMDEYFYKTKKLKKTSFSQILVGGRVACLKDKLDTWWRVDYRLAKLSKVLSEIKYYIKGCAIPFLSKMNTIEDVIEMLESTKSDKGYYGFYPSHTNPEPFQAILYLYINQKGKSIEIMDEVIQSTKSDLYRDHMLKLREKIENFDPTLYEV